MRFNVFRSGVTLVEMVIASFIALIPILVIGQMLVSGYRGEQRQWDSIHNQMRNDAQTFTIVFGKVGRKANKKAYNLYSVEGENFTLSEATDTAGEEVIGDAVEFIYWEENFDIDNAGSLMDSEVKGTRYALFYPDDGKLKVDYGSYPPSCIVGSSKRDSDQSEVIIENLKTIEFSHSTESKIGKGCVRARVVIENPETSEEMEIKAATFLRNVWPK